MTNLEGKITYSPSVTVFPRVVSLGDAISQNIQVQKALDVLSVINTVFTEHKQYCE